MGKKLRLTAGTKQRYVEQPFDIIGLQTCFKLYGLWEILDIHSTTEMNES